jgi:hypothetical protein
MLRRLLCSRAGAAVPSDLSCSSLATTVRGFASGAADICGLHGSHALPCTSLLPLVGALPAKFSVPAATDAQHAARALGSQTSGSLSEQYDRLHSIAQRQDAAAMFAAMQQAGSPFPRWRSGSRAAAAAEAATLPSYASAAVKAASTKFAPLIAGQSEAQQATQLVRRLAAVEWAAHWEGNSVAVVWRMDSVRRKRKHKMNKHKHRKRRKAQRHKT